jgi:hypothetical protein
VGGLAQDGGLIGEDKRIEGRLGCWSLLTLNWWEKEHSPSGTLLSPRAPNFTPSPPSHAPFPSPVEPLYLICDRCG